MSNARPSLLIVDDECNTKDTLREFLGRKYEVAGAGNGAGTRQDGAG